MNRVTVIYTTAHEFLCTATGGVTIAGVGRISDSRDWSAMVGMQVGTGRI